MKKTVASILAISVMVPSLAFAAELGAPNQGAPNVVLESYNSGTRELILRSGLIEPYTMFSCKVAAGIEIPSTVNKGRAIYVQYTGPGLGLAGAPPLAGNTCSQVSIN